MRLAAAGIGHRVGLARGVDHGEVAVDGEAQPHVVDRLPGAAHAGLQRVVVALDVGEVRLDVPQAVGALVALVAHAARVPQLALDVGNRQWHKARILAEVESPDALRPRPRPGHHQLARDRVRREGHGCVEIAQREFRQIFPQPGWVEHDPKEIYARSARSRARRCARPSMALKDVMGIGITNQRETTILWDRQTGEPIHNAIVWQDRRTAPQCARAEEAGRREPGARAHRAGDRSRTSAAPRSRGCSTTCPARAPAPSAASSPSARSTPGSPGSSPATARTSPTSRTPRAPCSSTSTRTTGTTSCCSCFDVPRAMLPDVHPSAHAFGMVPAAMLGEPLVIAGIAGDQQAAMFGQVCHRAGHGEEHLRHRLLHAAAHRRQGGGVAKAA